MIDRRSGLAFVGLLPLLPLVDVQMEVSGYHHNVAYDFLSLRPALYAAGSGEVAFRNFTYEVLR